MKNKLFTLSIIPLLLFATGCGSQASNQVHRKAVKPAVKNVNYHKPSEKKAYPKRLSRKDTIIVSQTKQRVYIMHGHHLLYTMYASTGSHHRTPNGTYHIQPERGAYFYSAPEHEGARYYTSWKGHGIYLFHATPNNRKRRIIKSVARDLGKKPSSHGCIHLTIPDAKYMMNHAKVGTKVIIRGHYHK